MAGSLHRRYRRARGHRLTALALAVMLAGATLTSATPAYATIPDILNDPVLTLLFPVRELRDLTGYNGARTYLFVGQNSYELRPTGGFISRVGLLRFYRGYATFTWLKYTYDIDQVYNAWLPSHGASAEPEPYEYYPFGPHNNWYLRDKNWWPDFKVTAKELTRVFAKEARAYNASVPSTQAIPLADPYSVNGVIAVDESVGSSILGVTGQVTLSAPGEPYDQKKLNSANFGIFSQWWESTNFSSQRGFFGAVSTALRDAVNSATGAKQSQLAMALVRALSERHIQIYSTNAANQSALEKLNWAGRGPSLPGDYLNVSDFNIGGAILYKPWLGNKVNMYVQRTVNYELDLSPANVATSTADIAYYNAGAPGYFASLKSADPNTPKPTYEVLEGAYYRAWSRVFVPPSAVWRSGVFEHELRSVNDTPTGKHYYGSWVGEADGLDPLETQHVVYRYGYPSILSNVPTGWFYRLSVAKQGGTNADPLHFRFVAPYLFISAVKGVTPTTKTSQGMTFDGDLKYDKVIEITLVPGKIGSIPTLARAGRFTKLQGFGFIQHLYSRPSFEIWRYAGGRWRLIARPSAPLITYSGNVKEFAVWYRVPATGKYRVRARFVTRRGTRVLYSGWRAFTAR